MNDVYPGDSRYVLEPFCIDKGTVEYFNLGCTPIHRESFPFGSARQEKKASALQTPALAAESVQRIALKMYLLR